MLIPKANTIELSRLPQKGSGDSGRNILIVVTDGQCDFRSDRCDPPGADTGGDSTAQLGNGRISSFDYR